MKPGTHLILPQNCLNRPMKVESPFFFEDEAMLAKVFNPRTKRGPAPANQLPEHIRLKRHDEWIDKRRRQQEAEPDIQAKGMAAVATARDQEENYDKGGGFSAHRLWSRPGGRRCGKGWGIMSE